MRRGGRVRALGLDVCVPRGPTDAEGRLAVVRPPAGVGAPRPDAVVHARVGGGGGEREGAECGEVREEALDEGALGGREVRCEGGVGGACGDTPAVYGDVGVCAAAA